jgi:hypothetical protein
MVATLKMLAFLLLCFLYNEGLPSNFTSQPADLQDPCFGCAMSLNSYSLSLTPLIRVTV